MFSIIKKIKLSNVIWFLLLVLVSFIITFTLLSSFVNTKDSLSRPTSQLLLPKIEIDKKINLDTFYLNSWNFNMAGANVLRKISDEKYEISVLVMDDSDTGYYTKSAILLIDDNTRLLETVYKNDPRIEDGVIRPVFARNIKENLKKGDSVSIYFIGNILDNEIVAGSINKVKELVD